MKRLSGRGSSDLSVLLYALRDRFELPMLTSSKIISRTDGRRLMGGTANVVNVAQLRERLRKMTDRQLRECGTDLRKLCKSARRRAEEPELELVIQLEEATAEWRRRKSPKTENTK